VVFVKAFGVYNNIKLKDWGPYVSWGQLVAAKDLIGINYDINETTGDPVADLRDLIAFVNTNAQMLGVEKGHLCLWSSSSNVQVALDLIADKEGTYQDSLSCAVIYYGFDETQEVSFHPSNIPLLIVKAGQDMPSVITGIDNLVGKVKAAGHPVELIEYKDGKHGFDFYQDTDETRDIVSRTLEFMKEKLTTQ
jgi:dienelactone hydrolase